MIGWGIFILGGTLIALTLYLHKRGVTWAALALALIAGVLIAASQVGGWIGDLGEFIPFLSLVVLIVGAAVIGLDLRDRRPDRPAVIFMMILPTFFVTGIHQVPDAIMLIGDAFGHLGTDTAQGRG